MDLQSIRAKGRPQIYVEDNEDAKIAKKFAIVGLWCIQWHLIGHPSMKVVVQMLEGKGDKLTVPPNPFASTDKSQCKYTYKASKPRVRSHLKIRLNT